MPSAMTFVCILRAKLMRASSRSCLTCAAVDAAHEDVVELQVVGLDVGQRREVRVARADVVDRDAEVLRAELREDLAEEALVDGVRALGDLEDDAVGLEPERARPGRGRRAPGTPGPTPPRARGSGRSGASGWPCAAASSERWRQTRSSGTQQLRALGEREERLAALELAAARAARERLHADHVAGREVEDRLEDRPDVLPRDDVLQQLAAPDLLRARSGA